MLCGRRRNGVELAERRPAQHDEHREKRTGGDHCGVETDEVDERRRGERAGDGRAVQDALEDPEDAREDVVGNRALKQREEAMIDHRVREPDHRDQDERAGRRLHTARSAIGAPHRNVPTAKLRASRDPTSASETPAPSTPPIPRAERSVPNCSSPPSRTSNATPAMRTNNAPRRRLARRSARRATPRVDRTRAFALPPRARRGCRSPGERRRPTRAPVPGHPAAGWPTTAT